MSVNITRKAILTKNLSKGNFFFNLLMLTVINFDLKLSDDFLYYYLSAKVLTLVLNNSNYLKYKINNLKN